ncbi:MAG: hypothetical protein FJ405_02130 [Verrucomicrobia bacterium]|nr:hypothetical protein [Verrucomicrobiota bacterium]
MLPASKVAGQWDFNGNKLAATVGKSLEYFDGPNGDTAGLTLFGTTAMDVTVPDINGEPAQVMEVPGGLSRNLGYLMTHGISPNGGGTLVNQYTLVMDIFVATTGPGAASLIQINSANNTDDGDLFWQGNNFGQGGGGYKGTGAFTAGAWHRVAAAYDMAATPPRVTKYVDGIFQDDWTANQSLDNPRRALRPSAILFGDGDQDERRQMWVNSIQISAGAMSKSALAALGGPTAAGIPIASAPATSASVHGDLVRISWPAWAAGYVLESTSSVTEPNWAPVASAGKMSATIVPAGPSEYFRLRKP